MRFTIDGKSALLGAFAGAALVAGLGAARDGEPPAGRFTIVAAGAGNGSIYTHVLDTATGQVWGSYEAGFSAPKLPVGK